MVIVEYCPAKGRYFLTITARCVLTADHQIIVVFSLTLYELVELYIPDRPTGHHY